MKLNKLTPNLAVTDIRQTVRFYRENLGFELVMAVPATRDGVDTRLAGDKEYVYAMMQREQVELMFQQRDSFREDVPLAGDEPVGASVSFYMEGKEIEPFHAALKNKNIQVSDVKLTWYGIKEFYMKDNNGYILAFAEEAAK
jgi:catechol 2,3-dioxygenase-like lactoylglutathione lyase family enzyme